MYTFCIYARDLSKVSNSPKGSSHHLKYHLQLTTKDVGAAGQVQVWERNRKSRGNTSVDILQTEVLAFPSVKNLRNLVILFLVQGGRHPYKSRFPLNM